MNLSFLVQSVFALSITRWASPNGSIRPEIRIPCKHNSSRSSAFPSALSARAPYL